ncbi:Putative uncharacterized protein [Lacticaseibacillus paracasei]|nr:Putative uncharacterized protein [Lacticaseibacillus paracasei]
MKSGGLDYYKDQRRNNAVAVAKA